MRIDYGRSLALLRERVEIIGDAQPSVVRPPRHDDESLGPSIFRQLVGDVALADLTLPGLYVGRSELRRVSFRGSDLHFATFNWSDFADCDFTAADLTGADLRACQFVGCTFRDADLSSADLRLSTFDRCTFERALMRGTKLHRRPRVLGFFRCGPDQTHVPLVDQQRREAEWCPDLPEPGGG